MSNRSIIATNRRLAQIALMVCLGSMSALTCAQQTGGSGASSPDGGASFFKSDSLLPAGAAAKKNAANTVEQTQGTPTNRAIRRGDTLSIRGGLITQVGSGEPVGEGSRVLRLPGKCTPKTGSLDCVTEAGQASTGANSSSKVRNSVIGEVGAGRAATDGAGSVKHKELCTPAPGKLTCD